MSENIIHLPDTEFLAPAPQRQGAVHRYYYTGEVTKPVWFRGRPLWHIRFRYGVTSRAIAEQVREEVHKLLELGEGQVYLPFPSDREQVREFLPTSAVNTSTKLVTYTRALAQKLDLEAPIQIGRYCLFPVPQTNVVLDELDNPIYDESGDKILQEAFSVIKYSNMPDTLPSSGGMYDIRQGQNLYYIRARLAEARQPNITYLSRKMARVDDINLVEVM